MTETHALIKRIADFMERQPNLDSSILLRSEVQALCDAAEAYLTRAEEIELTLMPDYAETAALMEGDGRNIATVDFIRNFSKCHCTKMLNPKRADKKARRSLLLLAAKDGKLKELRTQLDPDKKFRDLLQKLLELDSKAIEKKILGMKPADFRAMVTANGLDAHRTNSGEISCAKASRIKAVLTLRRIQGSCATLASV
jgi:hypothetical protein